MYARFHKRVSKVKQFVPLGELAAARLADGTLVFCAPLDHLAWTQTMANYVLAANQNVTAAPGIKAKQLQVAGTISPLAKAVLEQHGWKIQDRQEGRLITVRRKTMPAKCCGSFELSVKTPNLTWEVVQLNAHSNQKIRRHHLDQPSCPP